MDIDPTLHPKPGPLKQRLTRIGMIEQTMQVSSQNLTIGRAGTIDTIIQFDQRLR